MKNMISTIKQKVGIIMANAILAAVLSFLIPRLGQDYAGDVKKGAIFFIIAVVLVILSFFTAFLSKWCKNTMTSSRSWMNCIKGISMIIFNHILGLNKYGIFLSIILSNTIEAIVMIVVLKRMLDSKIENSEIENRTSISIGD